VRSRPVDLGRVASVVQRLAVLLAAGVPPAAAWGYLREGQPAEGIAASAAGGTVIPQAITGQLSGLGAEEQSAWRGLATAWDVATEAGAPLAPTLRDFAGSLRDLAQAKRDIAVALAAPVATARLVLALPLVGMLFGMVLGFNTFATLVTTPIGWACLVVGGILLAVAARWNRSLVRSARPTDLTPGLEFDLMAIAVSGGSSFDHARVAVASSLARYSAGAIRDDRGLESVLDLSRRAGVPAAELLRAEATERRRDARSTVQLRANALAIRLMLPLGVCVLPAFMVLGVVPLIATVLSSTMIG
jgi:tight adherence protein B